MDYTTQRLGFKVRKALRYVRLYGVRRTLVKIKGQYHMKKRYGALPALASPLPDGGHIGVIGCGNHAFANIALHLHKRSAGAIRGAMDTDIHRAASFYENYGLRYYTDDAGAIVADRAIDLVYIASNHASHAEYAIQCIEAGKRVHIEKPHVVSEDQLRRLASAMRSHPDSKVFLGFNRPHSALFKKLQGMLARQSGPLMINWFVAGHEIPEDHWYFDEKEGGRVLGNLCHWTDLTLHLVGMRNAFPCTIVPATPPGSKSDYVVSMMFADRSCASITFSAKGHTFEGVREVLNVHKGDLLANLTDFESLTAEIVAEKVRRRLRHRDHGQGLNVLNSLKSPTGEDPVYVVATARLFLAVRRAIDSGQPVALTSEEALNSAPMA
jgi:predicted dehydrogenase